MTVIRSLKMEKYLFTKCCILISDKQIHLNRISYLIPKLRDIGLNSLYCSKWRKIESSTVKVAPNLVAEWLDRGALINVVVPGCGTSVVRGLAGHK